MGVKLRDVVNPIEASIKEGKLLIYNFNKVIKEVELNIPKNIEINKQCNFFKTPFNNTIVYLSNDSYKIVIRLDGSVDILTNDFVLLSSSKVNVSLILDPLMQIIFCGSISLNSSISPAYLAISSYDDLVYIFTEDGQFSVLLDMTNEINENIRDWAIKHNDVGTMKIVDNSSGGTALWVNFGTNVDVPMKDFKVLNSNGVIGGVV